MFSRLIATRGSFLQLVTAAAAALLAGDETFWRDLRPFWLVFVVGVEMLLVSLMVVLLFVVLGRSCSSSSILVLVVGVLFLSPAGLVRAKACSATLLWFNWWCKNDIQQVQMPDHIQSWKTMSSGPSSNEMRS